MRFSVPPGRLEVDDGGRIGAVTAGRRRYLSGGGVAEVIIAGEARRPTPGRVALDADEVETEAELAGLTVGIRHTFAAGWGWRVRLANATAAELIIDEVALDLRPEPGMIAHPTAAGAEAELIIRPADGSGPILAGRLAGGAIAEITTAGPRTGPIRLAPGAAYVLTWQWTWYEDVARLAERRRGMVPWPAVRTIGEPIDLRGDPDAALIVPEDLSGADGTIRAPDGELTELIAGRPGSYPIEERSARGTVTFRLGWAPPLDQVLAERADRLPAAGRASAEAGIVLQSALNAGAAADPDLAVDTLEITAAELVEAGPDVGMAAVLLCLEHLRTGDPEPLRAAVDWILSRDRIEPGLGLAVTQACLARVVRGEPIAPIIERAGALAAAVPERPTLPLDETGIAEVELLAALHRNLDRPAPALRNRLLAAGPYLGTGEVGPPTPALPAEDQAALIAAVLFAGEQAPSLVGRAWAASPTALAESAIPPLLLSADGAAPSDRTLAWLALARVARS